MQMVLMTGKLLVQLREIESEQLTEIPKGTSWGFSSVDWMATKTVLMTARGLVQPKECN